MTLAAVTIVTMGVTMVATEADLTNKAVKTNEATADARR